MNATTVKNKNLPANWPDVDRQIRNAKIVLRELRDTLEDLDDRRELAGPKSATPEKLERIGSRSKKNSVLIFETGQICLRQ